MPRLRPLQTIITEARMSPPAGHSALRVSANTEILSIVIVSGLLSKGLGWQQIGEHEEHVLALAAHRADTHLKTASFF